MNSNLFYVRGVIIIILLSELYGLILDTCSKDDDCPTPTLCKPNGCKGFNCLCPPHTVVDETLNYCQSASQIGSRCDNNTRCLSKMAICESNICRCADFFRTSGTMQCSFGDERLIGENCSRSSECADAMSVCLEGSCGCAPGFREKTDDEYWADPLSRIQCVPMNFSLDYCGFQRLVLPIEITPSSTDVSEIVETSIIPDTGNPDSEINIEASDTLDIPLKDTVMPSEVLLPSKIFQTLDITPEIPIEMLETHLSSKFLQDTGFSDYDHPLITNGEIKGFTTLWDVLTDAIGPVTSSEPMEIEEDKSGQLETMMFTVNLDSMLYFEDGFSVQTDKTGSEVVDHTESDYIAPTEIFTVTKSIPVEDVSQADVDTTSPNTGGDNQNSRTSNGAFTNEDVKIIISLLGSGVGILFVLTIILVLFKLCRTGTTMSNAVSPEPQDSASVLKSVKRQRTLFKDRW